MNSKKGLLKTLIMLAAFVGIIAIANVSNASDDSTGKILKMNIPTYRTSGYAYIAGFENITPNGIFGNAIRMWKIFELNNSGGTPKNTNNAIYCLKMGVGFGSENGSPTEETTYKIWADMLNTSSSDQAIIDAYIDTLPGSTRNEKLHNYYAITWILQHAYVPAPSQNPSDAQVSEARTAKEKLLQDADIEGSNINDDLIDIVQQIAIWYFSNNDKYKTESIDGVKLTNSNPDVVNSVSKYKPLEDPGMPYEDDWDIYDDIDYLYAYFIGEADEYATEKMEQDVNVPEQNDNVENSIQLISSNATVIEDGNYYKVGPLKVVVNSNSNISNLSATLKDKNGNDISYVLLNSNGQERQLSQLVGQDFYIRTAKNVNIDEAIFKVTAKENKKVIKYWTKQGTNVQPVAIIENVSEDVEAQFKVTLSSFDLSLRKFITAINGIELKNTNGIYVREPNIDLAPLKNGTETTAIYKHRKDPIEVVAGDKVVYTLRVYNEGETSGYASKVTDYLPPYLKYIDNEFNRGYGWTYDESTRKVSTTKLSKENSTSNLINAFDGTSLDYKELKIECEVIEPEQEGYVITNIAEITACTDANGRQITDRDSQPNNLNKPEDLPNYIGDSNNDRKKLADSTYFFKGQEDDDDFEKLKVKEFDLSLRKFITAVNGTELKNTNGTYTREPVIDLTLLTSGTDTTAIYKHRKDPVSVSAGDKVIYTLRVYNEGAVSGYASKVTDYLPPYLKYIDSEFNRGYGWNYEESTRKVTTTKLSKENSTSNLINAFDGTNLDYKELKIECEVIEPEQEGYVITNIAEITACTDANGRQVTDRDSTPKNLDKPSDSDLPNYIGNENNSGDKLADSTYFFKGQEDDDDFEKVKLLVKGFDLSLRKYITAVNGEELKGEDNRYLREPNIDLTTLIDKTDSETTAHYKHRKDPVSVSVGDIVTYTIRVYNEGDTDGYVSEVTDYLPPQLKFELDDQVNNDYLWVIDPNDPSERTIKTTYLSKDSMGGMNEQQNLIKAFDGRTLDYKELKIRCKVVSTENYEKEITNIAEITACTNARGMAVTDIDSTPKNLDRPSDSDLPDYRGDKNNKLYLGDSDYFYKGQEDDDDFDKLVLQEFDLSLRKFITKINDVEPAESREPQVDTTALKNGTSTTAKYVHPKDPLQVQTADIVTYTIRVYNEGDIAGYANLVKDDIPEGLLFLPDDQTNKDYRWKMLDAEGKETTDVSKAKDIVTDYLSREQQIATGRNNLIKEYNKTTNKLDYKDLVVVFKVIAPGTYSGIITNKAQISDDKDENGNDVKDRDSTPDVWIEGEDDQDVEHIKLLYFDLALRKFITAVDNTEIRDRYPVFKITKDGKYVYEHTKEPVEVANGNIVTYTLRIYNEGTTAGYAKQVKDDIPKGLLFLPDNKTNQDYRWVMLDAEDNVTTDITKAVAISTDYLSKEQGTLNNRDNLLKPFDNTSMNEPDYRDIKIAFKVTEPNTSDRIIINYAQIADDEDKDGKNVVDIDSTPNKWIEGEDDQDIEKIKVKYFDLALRKWVTQAIVIENGKETVTETGHKAEDNPEEVVKVELKEKTYKNVVVKFRYKIRITNEGQIAGYATEISDYIPEGLKFVAADNPKWKEVDGKIVTDQLKDTLLQPGDTAEVEVLLTWINGKDNFGLKINVAEISKDKNDSNSKDIDSTPNNLKEGEDDIDDAPVILTVKTGIENGMQIVGIVIVSLAIISSGVVLIRKYVIE